MHVMVVANAIKRLATIILIIFHITKAFVNFLIIMRLATMTNNIVVLSQ